MKVEFTNIDDFLDEIAEQRSRIHDRVVRYRVDRVPEQEQHISELVGMWITALVLTEHGEFIVEFGENAGRDVIGESSENDPDCGTAVMVTWLDKLKAVCEKHNLTLRGGKIEVF